MLKRVTYMLKRVTSLQAEPTLKRVTLLQAEIETMLFAVRPV